MVLLLDLILGHHRVDLPHVVGASERIPGRQTFLPARAL